MANPTAGSQNKSNEAGDSDRVTQLERENSQLTNQNLQLKEQTQELQSQLDEQLQLNSQEKQESAQAAIE